MRRGNRRKKNQRCQVGRSVYRPLRATSESHVSICCLPDRATCGNSTCRMRCCRMPSSSYNEECVERSAEEVGLSRCGNESVVSQSKSRGCKFISSAVTCRCRNIAHLDVQRADVRICSEDSHVRLTAPCHFRVSRGAVSLSSFHFT